MSGDGLGKAQNLMGLAASGAGIASGTPFGITAGSLGLASGLRNLTQRPPVSPVDTPIARRLGINQQQGFKLDIPEEIRMSFADSLYEAEQSLSSLSPEIRREWSPQLYTAMLQASDLIKAGEIAPPSHLRSKA